MIGKTVSHYRILEKLGEGGMGVVYKAEDTRLGRTVALKFLPPELSRDEEAKGRFIQEAQAASRLDHNNICTIYEIDQTDDDQMFIAMAYYKGETLKKRMVKSEGREATYGVPVVDTIEIAVQIAQGLAKAHENGIIHRDIKPANVMITKDGVVKILDFGLAKLAGGAKLTKSGATLGTVAYMSPEQAHGEEVDHRTDIWSLGVVMYEMLTGQLPFKGEFEQALVYSILKKEPVPISNLRSNVPEKFEGIVNKAMQKETSKRYQNLDELLADLRLEQKSTAGIPKKKRAPPAGVRKCRHAAFGLAGKLVLLSIFILLMLFTAIPSFRHLVLPEQRRLAVLPFVTIGENPFNKEFSQGLMYTVTTILMKAPFHDAMRVISPSEVLAAGITNTREAANTFGVNGTIAGIIEHSGNSVRLTLTLVDVVSLTGLNSQTIYAQQKDLLTYQEEIVDKLAELLGVELTPESIQILKAGGTRVPGAYEFYLQGRGYLEQHADEAKVGAAISLFERAIAEDSTYALANAGLGEAYLRKYQHTPDKAYVDKAFQYGERAIALDSLLSPAHITRGIYYNTRGHHEEAIIEFRQALRLEPNDANTHRELATAYDKLGQHDLAEASYKKAIELKPEDWNGYNKLGIFYHNRGRHKEAAEQFRYVTKLAPDYAWGYNNLAAQYDNLDSLDLAIPWYEKATQVNPGQITATATAYFNLGKIHYRQNNLPEAIRNFGEALKLREDHTIWHMLANAYFYAGKNGDARAAWKRAIALAQNQLKVNPSNAVALQTLAGANAMLGERKQALLMIDRLLAVGRNDAKSLEMVGMTYEVLGERDLALQFIEEALENGLVLMSLETSKWLKNLRTDPRYKKLIQPYMRAK